MPEIKNCCCGFIPESRTSDEIKKSRIICVGDKFRIINDALEVMGRPPAGSGGPINSVFWFGDKKYIWFPHIAVEDNDLNLTHPSGEPWRNTLSFDYAYLCQKWISNDPIKKDNRPYDDLSVERGIFAKIRPKEGYTFLGVYKKLPVKDIYGADVFRRTACDLSIDDWKTE
jgi:hypothetical protein